MFRPISIVVVLNGYVVTVGCQTTVFNSKTELLRELDNYLTNPRNTEERFIKDAKNGYDSQQPVAVAAPSEYIGGQCGQPVPTQQSTNPVGRGY